MSTNISPGDFKLLAGDNKEGTKFPGEPAMRILSLGAGVQSSTMALMAEEGAFGVTPDAAIFADTGWEPPQVYEHLEWLKTKLSYPVYTIQYGNIREDIMNAMSESGNRFASAPFYTKNPDTGKKGMLRRQCTREYKITPIIKQTRELMGVGFRKRFPKDKWVEMWIGISTDEIMRMKPARIWWQCNRWPLIEKKMTREDCLRWYEGRDLRRPAKSACIGCPFHDDAFWADMKRNRPQEFKDACEIDEAIRKGNHKVKDNLYIHRSCLPLKEVVFKEKEKEPDLFNLECEGMCGL